MRFLSPRIEKHLITCQWGTDHKHSRVFIEPREVCRRPKISGNGMNCRFPAKKFPHKMARRLQLPTGVSPMESIINAYEKDKSDIRG